MNAHEHECEYEGMLYDTITASTSQWGRFITIRRRFRLAHRAAARPPAPHSGAHGGREDAAAQSTLLNTALWPGRPHTAPRLDPLH